MLRTYRRIAALLSCAALYGCPSGGEPITGCPTGSVEVNGLCRVTCQSHDDCLANEVCGPSGACVPGMPPPPPDAGMPDAVVGDPDATPDDTGVHPDAIADAGTEDTGEIEDTGAEDAGFPDAEPVDSGDGARAVLSTMTLDFGRSVIQTSRSLDLEVSNPTNEDVVVRFGAVSGANSADFSVTPNGGTVTLRPSDRTTVTIEYTAAQPEGAVSAMYSIELCDAGCPAQVALTATSIFDPIECTPSSVDFGLVNSGGCLTLPFDCTNTSNADADITAWALTSNSSGDFSLGAGPGFPIRLLPTRSQEVQVTYCPDADVNPDMGVVAVSVNNPNPSRTQIFVDVSGRPGGQDIECAPSMLDFGLVGTNIQVRRSVICRNRGNLPLMITSAGLSGAQAGQFTPATLQNGGTVALPVTLATNETLEVRLTHRPGAAGQVAASLDVASSDRDTPTLAVPVTSNAIDTTGCMLAVSPTTLDFGAVRVGNAVEQDITIDNSGTGPCAVSIIGLESQLNLSGASTFSINSMSPTMALAPNAQLRVRIGFTPTAAQPSMDTLQLQLSDQANASLAIPLSGAGYIGNIGIQPQGILYGNVPTGCNEPLVRRVTIANEDAAAALQVTDISVAAGSSAAYTVMAPALPLTLAPGETVAADVGFNPTTATGHGGRLQIGFSTGETFFVQLWGDGGGMGANTVTFPGAPARQVDVLFVIDNSGSMMEEQARLAAVAETFIAAAGRSRADYHFGVVTTDGTAMNAGVLQGMPAFIDRTTMNAEAELATRLAPGTTGAAQEQGLFAASEAVTNAMLLAGSNAGFLQANGELHVVVLSDAEDDSPATVATYVMAMQGRATGMAGVRVHTITGRNTGCNNTGTNASSETRYQTAAMTTMGQSFSVCEQDYSDIAESISQAIFGAPQNTFQLGTRAIPGSIEVTLNGTIVPERGANDANYFVDNIGAQVVFPFASTPTATIDVEIAYDAFCVSTSCGNNMEENREQCDDGDMDDTNGCTNRCFLAICGDGSVQAGMEQCDDGNTVPDDGCDDVCAIEGCGNGIMEPGEECDNGAMNSNTAPDACRLDCTNPRCGDSVADMNEECDDGNTSNLDSCLSCMNAECGDGSVQLGVEQCDDGNMNDLDSCNSMCNWTIPALVVTSTPAILNPADGQAALMFSGGMDNGVSAQAIGFPFTHLGATVQTVFVSTNGWISFIATGDSAPSNRRFPSPATPNSTIGWWWTDLNLSANNVAETTVADTRLDGAMPNRVRTITFQNVAQFGPGSSYYLLTAEIRLYEVDSRIEVHYGAVQTIGTTPLDFSASAGWEDATGANGFNILGCGSTCGISVWPTNTIFTYRSVN